MMKTAYLVLGAESTGTRYVTSLLIAGGCKGDAEHKQRWDEDPFAGDPIVWRRSVPHARKVPVIAELVGRLMCDSYLTHALVVWRDWNAAARGQVAAGHVGSLEDAYENLAAAYPHIVDGLARTRTRWTGVSYEALESGAAREALGVRLGLPHPTAMAQVEFVRSPNAL